MHSHRSWLGDLTFSLRYTSAHRHERAAVMAARLLDTERVAVRAASILGAAKKWAWFSVQNARLRRVRTAADAHSGQADDIQPKIWSPKPAWRQSCRGAFIWRQLSNLPEHLHQASFKRVRIIYRQICSLIIRCFLRTHDLAQVSNSVIRQVVFHTKASTW